MNTLEKMARAIDPGAWMNLEAYVKIKGYSIEEVKRASASVQLSLDRALAALKAIREPSEAAQTAGASTLWISYGGKQLFTEVEAAECYRAMIDHIIAQGETK